MGTIRLTSVPLINTPSIITSLVGTGRAETDPDYINALGVIAAGWPKLPVGLILALIKGELKYTIDHKEQAVVLEISDEQEKSWGLEGGGHADEG